jgi:hypothetical protein
MIETKQWFDMYRSGDAQKRGLMAVMMHSTTWLVGLCSMPMLD